MENIVAPKNKKKLTKKRKKELIFITVMLAYPVIQFLLIWIFVALMVSYIRIERDDEEPKKIAPRVTSADLEIVLTKENDQNDVPRRKYVRVPRVKGKDFEDEDEIAKEFDEELDEEPVKKDESENKPIEIPFKVEEIENEGGDELKNEEE